MSRSEDHDEDALWADIVANYGERPRLDKEPDGEPAQEPRAREVLAATWDDEPEPSTILDAPEERFVPPPPPPLPRVERTRLWAWLGLFGAPAILLICLIFTISMPPLLAWALVAWFVGGFGWLVWLMPPGPRDPDDDGARV